MREKNCNLFAKVRRIAVFGIVCMFLFATVSCKKEEQHFERVTGIIIGYHFPGQTATLLVQVDRKYPIGRTIRYTASAHCAWAIQLPNEGSFRNIIGIQPRLYLLSADWEKPETEIYDRTWYEVEAWLDTAIGKRISFSYREPHIKGEEYSCDGCLFVVSPPVIVTMPYCFDLNIPLYVVTDIRFLN